jgi:hypothetical protein
MGSPVRGLATTDSQIEVDWLPLVSTSATGNAAILSYNLQWDLGTSGTSWTDLVGYSPNSLVTMFPLNDGIVAGSSYQF